MNSPRATSPPPLPGSAPPEAHDRPGTLEESRGGLAVAAVRSGDNLLLGLSALAEVVLREAGDVPQVPAGQRIGRSITGVEQRGGGGWWRRKGAAWHVALATRQDGAAASSADPHLRRPVPVVLLRLALADQLYFLMRAAG